MIGLERALLLAAGAAMVLLAGIVLASGAGRPVHRVFAALLALRGGAMLLAQLSQSAGWVLAGLTVQPYFAIALVPVALYCLLAVRDLGTRPRALAGWATLGAIVLLDGAYAFEHTLFHTLAPGDPALGAIHAAPGYTYTDFGPLAALASMVPALLGLLGLRIALRYREQARSPQAVSLLLVAAGLMLGSLFDGASRLAALSALLDSGSGYPWLPWGWGVAVLPVLAIVPALLTAVVLAAGRNVAPRPQRALEGRFLALAAFAFFSGFLRLVGPSDSDPAGQTLGLVLMGIWRLAMPVLVAYGIVRESWVAVQGRAREGLAWAALSAFIAGCGFAAVSVSPDGFGPLAAALLGLVAASIAASLSRWTLPTFRRAIGWLAPADGPTADAHGSPRGRGRRRSATGR